MLGHTNPPITLAPDTNCIATDRPGDSLVGELLGRTKDMVSASGRDHSGTNCPGTALHQAPSDSIPGVVSASYTTLADAAPHHD